ncbi:DUF2764 family protein [candidate division KSB1 bacterium]|nr:DUF2764 family protein [candidate division KSB1 bacterium]
MDKYYYLVSLLPTLYFDKEPEISADYFMQELEKWTSRRDFDLLSSLDIRTVTQERSDPLVLKQYKRRELAIRDDLVTWRREKSSGREHKPASFASSILKEGNPLIAEKNLLRLRWDFLSELDLDHHFDLEALIIYHLKLQILQRLAQFDKEKGLEKYRTMYKVSI